MISKTTGHLVASHLAAGLAPASHPGQPGPATGRIVLLAVALLSVGTFTLLQVRARSQLRRPPGRDEPRRPGLTGRHRDTDPRRVAGRRGAPDWRTPPSRYGRDAHADEAPDGNQERYRPDWRYGYPPGYESGRRERGPAS